MNRVEELIRQLCPNGVEWKKLGDYIELHTGEQLNKDAMLPDGIYPVMNGGVSASGFTNSFNEEADTITISQGGASAGFVNWMTSKFWAGAHCFVVKITDDNIINRYLYFCLKSSENRMMRSKYGAGIPSLSRDNVNKLLIPVPPLAVQQEIVSILNTFSDLTTNLQIELDARRKQYAYYRDCLLSFEGVEGVEWKRLGEIFNIKNGYTPSKTKKEYWEHGNIPWFRMEDIRENGRILFDSIQHVNRMGIKGGALFPANSIILATSATIGEHALILVDYLANQRFSCLALKQEFISLFVMKYVYYYMFIVDEWCKNHTNVSGFASVDMEQLKKYMFPIPPLSEQHRIVSILDRFEALASDLTAGIPAELEARRKQYEYYRDKLLNFKRL